MTTVNTLEALDLPGVVDRDGRRRQFVAESSAAPWAKCLRPGDRIETAGHDRETVTVIVEDVCVHAGYAGLDDCLKHPMRDHDITDARLFEVLAAAFVALQVEPEEIRSARPSEVTVVVYAVTRGPRTAVRTP